jgi:hypothetical protein
MFILFWSYSFLILMKSLAIVGAGIGGCSAAYFAHKSFPSVNITLYDAQDRLGGRILSRNVAGASLEMGAAFFNGFNKTISSIVKAEHLNVKRVEERMDFGVWTGSELIFRSKKSSAVTDLKLLVKYKLNLVRTFLLIREAKRHVAKLYREELKNSGDMSVLFESACLDKWHKKPFDEILIERGISQAFIDEVVDPITRTIYTQNADLGGFAGISSLIGVYSGKTYSIAEGNSTLPVHLAEASNAAVKLGQKVSKIQKTSEDSYRVYSGNSKAVFDAVIIAAPLGLADIEFDGVSLPNWPIQPYRTVYRRVMQGVFDPNYFLKNSADPPAIVLTTKDADPITQFSVQKTGNGESLVTVSSPEPIIDEAFNGVFKNDGVTVLEHCWKAAYPIFKPVTNLPPSRIDKRLLYVNAVEPSVSSMETSALSALNAVRMLGQEWR